MRGLIELIRLGIYGFLIYQLYPINLWISVSVGMCFVLIELAFFLLGYLKRQVDAIGFAQSQAINTDFGFESHALTIEEEDLISHIRDGDLTATITFLSGRCQNKLIDFKLLPDPVMLLLAKRLINAINRHESPTWSELLTNTENE